jgi:2-iminobutanoate/2-iminopropanoate deaminase
MEAIMQYITSDKLPTPAGHYSQAIRSGQLVFVSGQIPSCGNEADFETQTLDALQKCAHILKAAGCSFNDVVQCTAYIVGIDNWSLFNKVYSQQFGEHRPARAVVPVPELHYGMKVEIQMTAVLSD